MKNFGPRPLPFFQAGWARATDPRAEQEHATSRDRPPGHHKQECPNNCYEINGQERADKSGSDHCPQQPAAHGGLQQADAIVLYVVHVFNMVHGGTLNRSRKRGFPRRGEANFFKLRLAVEMC